jgi:recombination protein RecT
MKSSSPPHSPRKILNNSPDPFRTNRGATVTRKSLPEIYMSTQLAAKGDLKSLINSDAIRAQIARALPKHMTPDRFLRVATTTLLRVPKLAQCSQESFMKAMLDCSSLGLEPDGRRCHLIPYGTDVQLIVDWKGLVELAKRSGEVLSWKAETVKEKDKFGWVNGVIHHEVNWREDRGKLEAVYSIVKLEGGEVDTEVMTLAEVEAIRKRSKASGSGPWVTDFEEMAKKTVIRRHSKRLTLSPEFHTALEIDADKIDTNRDRAQAEADRISFDGPAMIAESVEVEGSSDE